ncbi:MAG: biotin/lipoate A/B protein ligase family protein [Pirellulales bacterium]
MTASPLVVWCDGAADGPGNMAADELLAEESARLERPLLRLYDWTTPTVSLGAFQPLAEVGSCAAVTGLPLVRRPSGGGAILHGTDVTYAMAVPKTHPWGRTPQTLYDALHGAMVEVLAGIGIATRLHVAAIDDPPGDAFLCFDRRAPGDLVGPAGPGMRAPKLMGSAQRRLGASVLQHGSLLVASPRGVGSRHPGVIELLGGAEVPAATIVEPWLARVATLLGSPIERRPDWFTRGREAQVEERAGRFRDPRWTGRR